MRRIVTLAAAATMLAGAAQAQRAVPRPGPAKPAAPVIPTRVTAKVLTDLCGQDRNACLTYILGATDAYASALVAAGRPQVFCVPKGTTNDQIAQAVVRYLRAHAEESGNNAGPVVLAGLQTSYPCGY